MASTSSRASSLRRRSDPPDAPMLAHAIERIKTRFGRAPRAVTADRNYGQAAVDNALVALGVALVAMPRPGRPSTARAETERARRFRRLVKWRTGSEARIACLKRDYLWRRSLFDTLDGARTWCGWGVLAHNSVKLTALAAARDQHGQDRRTAARIRPGTDPPTTAPSTAA